MLVLVSTWREKRAIRCGRRPAPRPAGKAATPLPQPRLDAKLPQRRRRAKTGGRDFVKGQNSQDGTVFRRTEDQLPRGNATLMLRIVYKDKRQKIYDQLCALIDESPRGALAFHQEFTDRTEGTPVKRVERAQRCVATFIFANGEDALPARPSPAAPAAAVTPEDLVILGPEFMQS